MCRIVPLENEVFISYAIIAFARPSQNESSPNYCEAILTIFLRFSVIQLLSKKPVGILHLLDDESNFPRASDASFLEKCHYNHALNELYSRPRLGASEFGVRICFYY